jgi:hypothetical protein
MKSRDSSVGIALGYGLDDRGSRVRFPAGAGNFSLHHRVQNGSGAHPASYTMGTAALSPEVKRPEREVDHSPPSSAVVNNAWSYTSTPQYVFMAWCLDKPRDNFIFQNYCSPKLRYIPTKLNLKINQSIISLSLILGCNTERKFTGQESKRSRVPCRPIMLRLTKTQEAWLLSNHNVFSVLRMTYWTPKTANKQGVMRPGHEADHSPPSSAEVKEWVELYLHSPISLHGAVLSYSTGTTLPLSKTDTLAASPNDCIYSISPVNVWMKPRYQWELRDGRTWL